jgi:hypothetical protein
VGPDDRRARRWHQGQFVTKFGGGEEGSAEAKKEAARQARGHIFFIFSMKRRKWLIIEDITLLEYVKNF